MPEHIRALLVILALAATVFLAIKSHACALATTPADFQRRRNLWFGITLTAFLAHNFWLYIMIAAIIMIASNRKESNRLALYYLLLFAVPPISAEISGLGVIRSFFAIDYLRLLSLTILFPAFLKLWNRPDSVRFGRLLPDKLIAGYLVLVLALTLSASTFTHSLRSGVLYSFVDIFLPYYVASRSLKNINHFRDALTAFVIAALVLSTISVFEFARHWLLYSGLNEALGVRWAYGIYLERGGDGMLRAQGSTGHAIPLGFVMAVAIGFYLYLKRLIPNKMMWRLGLLALIAGIIAPVSRGPWVGAVAIILVFLAVGVSPLKNLLKLAMAGLLTLPLLLVSPLGEKIISYLPFVGSVADETVDYRQRLLEIAIGVILQNPFFGAFNYMYSPEMQSLQQGQGIIDIVNSFIGVGLASGLVGLSLYSFFFLSIIVGIFITLRKLPEKNDEHHFLGQALLATLVGIMVMISTVSSISVIPLIYWSVAGIGVAYMQMVMMANKRENVPDQTSNTRTKTSPSMRAEHRKLG